MKIKTSFLISMLGIIILMPISAFAITERVSVDDNGIQANSETYPISITPDGRYVLFYSYANNLVANDTNGGLDIFVRDTINNTIIRANIDDNGIQTNADTYPISITPDGRYVLFHSYADNLVANDTNGSLDVFVRDTVNGTTIRANVDDSGNEANSQSEAIAITPDGRYVLFQSYADNLIANDTNGAGDVFVRDTINNTTLRVSVDNIGTESNGYSYGVSITPDGRYILFHSDGNNFALNDTNGQQDVFVRDIINNTTTLISADNSGNIGNSYSQAYSITPDGRYVLFDSYSDNLVANDTNFQQDVFVRDTVNNTTIRVSENDLGDGSNSYSQSTMMTPDGRYVLFMSYADNLVVSDTNGSSDVFMRDFLNNTTLRVSEDELGNEGNNNSAPTAITSGGEYVLFYSDASNLVTNDTNGGSDIYVKNTVNGIVTKVNVDNVGNGSNSSDYPTTITPDGRYVLFPSYANNLVLDDTNGVQDIFVNERQLILGAAPTIVTPVDGSYRNHGGDFLVQGLGESGADIRVTFLGNEFTTIVNSNNEWALQLPGQLDASYTIYAQQKPYGAGVWSATGDTMFTIDTVNPPPPSIISPIDNVLISGGNIRVSGVGEIGGAVTVIVGNTTKTSSIDGFGNWNVGPFTVIPGYKYGIVAKQQDIAGNQSYWSEVRTIYGVGAGTVTINDADYKPELVLTKRGQSGSGSISTINPNENIRYTLDYLNVGNSFATGVVIYETIPVNTCYTIGSISGLNQNYSVEYSNNQGVSYVYTPVGSTGVQDCNVTNFKVTHITPYEAKLQAVNDQFDGIRNSIIGSTELTIPSSLYTPKLVGPSGYHKFGHGVSADFNNDGKVDVIGMGFGGGTTVFTNISTGNNIAFSTIEISPGFGSNLVGGDIGDFNNDGLIDAVGFGYNGFNTLFINTTSGGIISFSSSSFGTHENSTYHHGGDIADFNNDGKLDIIAMGHWGYTKIYTNISTGANVVFQQTTTTVGGTNGYFVGGAVGDFNNDGRIDAVAGGHLGPTTVFTNISTGANIVFSTQLYAGYDQGGNPEVGDFNNDGKLDFIRGSTYNNLFINTTVGTGTPTFSNYTIQGGLGQPVVYDYDNDGRLDIFSIGGYTSLRIYNNISTGLNTTFDAPIIIPEGQTAPHGVVGSDFNNDGKIDIMGFAWESNVGDYRSVVYQSNTINSGVYTSILYSTGNISGWDKIIMQEDIVSGNNMLLYDVYGVMGGNTCDDSVVVISRAESLDGEIDLHGYTGSNICVKVEFNIITGSVSPILKSIIGVWNNEDIESFTFDVKVKAGNFIGTTVRNTAYINSSAIENNTGNNEDTHLFTGLPDPIPGGGFGGGIGTPSTPTTNGGGNGGGTSSNTTITNSDGTTTVVIKDGLTPQEVAGIIKEIDTTKPDKPVVIIPKPTTPTGPVTSVEVTPTTPNIAIKEAIVQTSYVSIGSTVEVKTVSNPALSSEKKCYTPKEVVDITLGKNTTNKDQLVYQALLKSYDLTMFSDTDTYMPENGLKRYEAAKMFTNFAKHVLCRESTSVYANIYTDIEGIDETLRPYIIQAYEYGILKGSKNEFRPLERISRKEFVAALMRMFTNENMDVQGMGNDWDINYQEAFKAYGLESIVGVDEEINRYAMSKIMYKLYYNTTYEWTEKGYVLPYGRD